MVVSRAIFSSAEKVLASSGVAFLDKPYAPLNRTFFTIKLIATRIRALGRTDLSSIGRNTSVYDINGNLVQDLTMHAPVVFSKERTIKCGKWGAPLL